MDKEQKRKNLPILRGQGIKPGEFVQERSPYTQFQTWLGETQGVVGCPVDCQYCFFQLDGQTPVKPQINLSPEEMIRKLGEAYTYSPEIPVNYGSETDAFSTRKNVDYYSELLQRYGESEYQNPVIFISKRAIPEKIMDIASEIKQPVLFYMSFSGLDGTEVEPTVKSKVIKENFVKLKDRGLPAIHYWRPFLPQNSTAEKIEDVLDHVSQYATCSVVNGLRLNDGIRENIAPFWPELKEQDYDFAKSGEFWPEGVRDFLIDHVGKKYPDYPVFFGNTPCSVTYALDKPDIRGLYNGKSCQESNCPPSQREKCGDVYRVPSIEEVQEAATKMEINQEDVGIVNGRVIVKGKVESGKLVYMRYALKFPVASQNVGYEAGYNWANVRDEGRIIEVPWRNNWITKTQQD